MKTIIRYARAKIPEAEVQLHSLGEELNQMVEKLQELGLDEDKLQEIGATSLKDKFPPRKGEPVKTLVVFLNETMAYWGIGRCNIIMDNPKKEVGRETAAGRAWEVQRKINTWAEGAIKPKANIFKEVTPKPDHSKNYGTIWVRKDKLAGYAKVEDLDSIFKYFYSLDLNQGRTGLQDPPDLDD